MEETLKFRSVTSPMLLLSGVCFVQNLEMVSPYSMHNRLLCDSDLRDWPLQDEQHTDPKNMEFVKKLVLMHTIS